MITKTGARRMPTRRRPLAARRGLPIGLLCLAVLLSHWVSAAPVQSPAGSQTSVQNPAAKEDAAKASAAAATPVLPRDAQHDFKMAEKSKEFTKADLLAKFEGEPEESYTLGAGDELTIEVWDHPELSGKHVVGPDGKITLSGIGPMPVSGMSREDTTSAVTEAFSRYYMGPLVTVRVDRYVSNRIYILGRVSHPGALEFQTPPTLLEAITLAGGLPIGGIGAEKAALARCAIFRGRDRMVTVELKNLLTGANLGLNIRLKRNDVVYIPDSDDQLVYVLGEVRTPGAYRLTPNMTFLDALSLAGGPTRDAVAKRLHVIRASQGLNREISFDDLLKPHAELNFSLSEGDIIYVPRRGLAKLGYVMDKLTPFTTLLLLGRSL